MTFMQIMTFSTSDIEQVSAMHDHWRQATEGKRTLRREILARDHERPGRYVALAFFDSYESAMQNSQLPETEAAAELFQKLSDEPMTFRNLEVIDDQP